MIHLEQVLRHPVLTRLKTATCHVCLPDGLDLLDPHVGALLIKDTEDLVED